MTDRPSERWMWGREAALGATLYWEVHHKVLRRAEWVWDFSYACGTEELAHTEADVMSRQTFDGRPIYREVSVSGPRVRWREIGWKEGKS